MPTWRTPKSSLRASLHCKVRWTYQLASSTLHIHITWPTHPCPPWRNPAWAARWTSGFIHPSCMQPEERKKEEPALHLWALNFKLRCFRESEVLLITGPLAHAGKECREGWANLDFRAGSEPECDTEADAASAALWTMAGRGQE